MEFVSRAGNKLQHALEAFKIDVTGFDCIDYGCSTGGFTDCLLKNGANSVCAVDTAYGELSWGLRNNPKVDVHERTNALYFAPTRFFDLAVIDMGWTKQDKIIPLAAKSLKVNGIIISLLKPHYEIGIKNLINGKVPPEKLDMYLKQIQDELSSLFISLGLSIVQIVKSPVLGDKAGNTEYLMLIKKSDNSK